MKNSSIRTMIARQYNVLPENVTVEFDYSFYNTNYFNVTVETETEVISGIVNVCWDIKDTVTK